MNSRTLLVCSAERQRRRRSYLRLEPTVVYDFKSHIQQKRLSQTLFNPAKRKQWRIVSGQKSTIVQRRQKPQSGFKGTRILKPKYSQQNMKQNRMYVMQEYAKRHKNFKQYESRCLHSPIRFAYNLSLYERKYNPDQIQNVPKKHLFDCLIKRARTQHKQQNKFDIQSIPATIQPRVLSNKL